MGKVGSGPHGPRAARKPALGSIAAAAPDLPEMMEHSQMVGGHPRRHLRDARYRLDSQGGVSMTNSFGPGHAPCYRGSSAFGPLPPSIERRSYLNPTRGRK